MFMKQIFIKVALMIRFGRFVDFGYRRQRRMWYGNIFSPETVRTKSNARFTVNPVARNDFSRNGFGSFAETFSKEHYHSAIISKQLAGISVGKNTNPQMSSDFSLFIQSTMAAFSPRRSCPPAFFRRRFRHCLETFIPFGGAHDFC